MIINGFDLVKTSSEFPEQYDVFKDGHRCGYIRIRYGFIETDYWPEGTDYMAPTVYQERISTTPIGKLPDEHREMYLKRGLDRLESYLNAL